MYGNAENKGIGLVPVFPLTKISAYWCWPVVLNTIDFIFSPKISDGRDYSSATIDQSKPNSIWVGGQYYYHPSSSTPVWSTYIGKIKTESSRR